MGFKKEIFHLQMLRIVSGEDQLLPIESLTVISLDKTS